MSFAALERRPRSLGSALALFSGAVFALTSPPTNLTPSIFVGLFGLAWLLSHAAEDAGPSNTALRGALYGLFFGAGANLVALRFVPEVILRFTPLPLPVAWLAWALLSFAQGISWALAGALSVALARRGVPRFLAYATGVYLALFVPGLFPWTPAGGLTPWPVLVQTAEVVGERGTSLLVALFVGMLAEAQRTPASRRKLLGTASLVVVVVLGYGALRLSSVEASRLEAPKSHIALVQPGTGATMRWDPQAATRIAKNLHDLTKSAETRGVDLVVWPEAAFPYSLSHATRRSSWGDREVLGGGIHGPVIVGLTLQKDAESSTNSAMVARGDGSLSAPYDKRHLLAFGESVPLADEIPWLKKTFARGTGLEPGKTGVTLEAGDVRAGVLICYEDNLPAAGREAMREGGSRPPNLLVNLTNDAWFSGSAEGELHLRLAVLRAVETRRDLVRAVNLGPTSFVTATGKVLARYDAPFPKAIDVEARLLETPPTPYVRFGDTPVLLAVAAACLFHVARARRRAALPRPS